MSGKSTCQTIRAVPSLAASVHGHHCMAVQHALPLLLLLLPSTRHSVVCSSTKRVSHTCRKHFLA
jgi:hypothetical protein